MTILALALAAQTPAIKPGGVVDAASYAPAVAPGSLATVFGTFPGVPNSTAAAPLPLRLGGLSLDLSNIGPIPLYFVSNTQANVQIPWEAPSSWTTPPLSQTPILLPTMNGTPGSAQTLTIHPFAPAIFLMNASQGTPGAILQGAILHADGTLADSSHPAHPGEVISIYATGLGPVTNPPPTGSPALSDPLSVTIASTTVFFNNGAGGVWAPALFSGLAPVEVGVYQINVEVPTLPPTSTALQSVHVEVEVSDATHGAASNYGSMGYLSPTVTPAPSPAPAPAPSPAPFFSGVWIGSWTTNPAGAGSGVVTLDLVQSGYYVSGSAVFSGSCVPNLTFSAQQSAYGVAVELWEDGYNVAHLDFTGYESPSGHPEMSGHYVIRPNGPVKGCLDSLYPLVSTFSAARTP